MNRDTGEEEEIEDEDLKEARAETRKLSARELVSISIPIIMIY